MPRLGALFLVAASLTIATECRLHHRHRTVPGCSRCGPGLYVVRPCDPYRQRDTECGPCPPGSYSPHHSYAGRCYPCARCGQGLYEAHSCNPLRDTVCDSCHTFKGPHNGNFRARCGLADFTSTGIDKDHRTTEVSSTPNSAQDQRSAEEDTGAHRAQSQVPEDVQPEDAGSNRNQVQRTKTKSRTDLSSSRTLVLVVLLISAAGSFAFFVGLAALALSRHRASSAKKMHLGQKYSPVQTVDPVML